ncbi:TetR/AcrR family transcriptional regulator [Amycolatopsis umgeniensis]|uniref:AcrR family transcriptional regulator n=1 Tax=Amycolatopsis umgeniensis TaxID=336628 RepID=A0A841B3P0_9PSEU|nr:TetR/AcrR family transcriptional regulator [Amycolatopsis umgeniensis]MBB5853623.1 AcrR family transcriptional regulator [Amycolatopsis umgeniensis]
MAATQTARERARAELTREIKDEARRQLAEVGALGLSLRAVARELGMVSSALYRYFSSREQLLTALIVDAYNAVGEAAEAADDAKKAPLERWTSIWQAVRDWAKAHPHEYALIYGSPIPGYQAPQDTVAPAGRVAFALVAVLRDANLRVETEVGEMPVELLHQLDAVAGVLKINLAPETASRLIMSWTQLFGMINFELFGQYVGSVDPSDAFFAHGIRQMAEFTGIKMTG